VFLEVIHRQFGFRVGIHLNGSSISLIFFALLCVRLLLLAFHSGLLGELTFVDATRNNNCDMDWGNSQLLPCWWFADLGRW
jgi:hypothetical protein